MLSGSERQAIAAVVGSDPGATNEYLCQDVELEMRFGFRPAQPVCRMCGGLYSSSEAASECERSH